MSNDQQTTSPGRQIDAERDEDPALDRPDRRGPRGNQDVEHIDVERGEGKLERVLGW